MMYELIAWITVSVLSGTLICGVEVINRLLIQRGRKPIRMPREWIE